MTRYHRLLLLGLVIATLSGCGLVTPPIGPGENPPGVRITTDIGGYGPDLPGWVFVVIQPEVLKQADDPLTLWLIPGPHAYDDGWCVDMPATRRPIDSNALATAITWDGGEAQAMCGTKPGDIRRKTVVYTIAEHSHPLMMYFDDSLLRFDLGIDDAQVVDDLAPDQPASPIGATVTSHYLTAVVSSSVTSGNTVRVELTVTNNGPGRTWAKSVLQVLDGNGVLRAPADGSLMDTLLAQGETGTGWFEYNTTTPSGHHLLLWDSPDSAKPGRVDLAG